MMFPYLIILCMGWYCILELVDAQYTTNLELTSAPEDLYWTSVAGSGSGERVVATSKNGSIFISENNGYSWKNASVVSSQWSGVASSSSGEYLYAVTLAGSIFMSNDYGSDWMLSLASNSVWYSICTSSSGKYAFAAAFGGIISFTNNYGGSWLNSTVERNSFTSITCSSSGQYVAAAAALSYIYISNNYGVNFNRSDSSVQNWQSIVSNSSGQFLAAIAPHGNIFTSSDYGQSWITTNAPHIDWKAICMSGSGQFIYALSLGDPLYYSTDYGVIWSLSDSPGQTWTSIASSASGQFIYALTALKGVYANYYTPTSQPSSTPSVVPSSFPSSEPTSVPTIYSFYSYVLVERYSEPLDYFSVAMSNVGQFVYVGASYSGFFQSLDFGNSWTLNVDIAAFAVTCSSNGSVVFAGGYNIYRSTDFANTWTLTSAPTGNYHGLAASATGQFVYAVGSYALLYSDSYGDNWTASYGVNASIYAFTAIACSKSGQYVTAISASGEVYNSHNYGVNFTQVFTGLYESYAVTMSADGQYQVAGAQNGEENGEYVKGLIYRSTDYGLTWTATSVIAGDWICAAMSSSGQYVFAGLFEADVYYSADYGINWSKIQDSVGDWYSIAVSGDAQFLAAVSFDIGIYTNQYNIPSSMPTSQPSPTADKPHSALPTSQPSRSPTRQPTRQPSSYPTYIPDTIVETVQVLATDASTTHTFNNLGCGSPVFVWASVLVSYLDADSLGAISITAGVGDETIVLTDSCAPSSLCGSVQCVANFNVSSVVSCSGGGSLTLSSSTVNVDQFTGVDTRCTYNGTTGLQYALFYSVSAYPLPTANPTPAPTLQGNGNFVFEASPETPFYIITLVVLIFLALGVFFVRLRDKKPGSLKMKILSVCVDLAWIGYHLSSEVFYIIVVYTEGLHDLAYGIVAIRSFSLVPGFYFLVSLYGPNQFSEYYDSKLNKTLLFKNASLYSLITVMMVVEQTMIRYLPWKECPYATMSRGFPDRHILTVCTMTKTAQLFCALGVQLTVLAKTNVLHDSSKIALAIVLLYLISSIGTILMFVVTNGIRVRLGGGANSGKQTEAEADSRLKSDEAIVTVPSPLRASSGLFRASGAAMHETQLVKLSKQKSEEEKEERETLLAEQQQMKGEISELKNRLAELEALMRRPPAEEQNVV